MKVRRTGFLFVIASVVAMVLCLAVAMAEAQYNNPVQSLIQGNLNMVHGSRMYGMYGGGYYQPQYENPYQQQQQYQPQFQQQGGRPMTTFEGGILGGVLGALGTRTFTRNTKVITGVSVSSAIIGALWARHNGQKQQLQFQQQQQYSQGQGHGHLVPASPAPEYQQAPVSAAPPNEGAQPWPEQNQAEPALPNVQIKNCTRVRGELYDWDTPMGVWLRAGESVSIPASSRGGYRLLAEIPSSGGMVRSWADSRYQDSTGSILFIEPTGR